MLTVLAGIVLFAEPANRELLIGILLTLVGIALISYTEGGKAVQTAEPNGQAQE